jgi:MIP family channel proteins
VEPKGTSAYIAEFIGTFFLVLFICIVVTVYSKTGLGYQSFIVVGMVHAWVLGMLIYTLAGGSGAHFNPAVTTVMAALRKIAPADAVIYIMLQLAGAVAAALVCKLILLDEGAGTNYGATTISDTFLQGKASAGLLVEIIGTFMLVWAIMGTVVNPKGAPTFAGLVVGGTLGFAVMCFGPLDGAGFNPARSFGPALVAKEWSDFWVYVVGPVVGALLAGFSYKAILIGPDAEEPLRDAQGAPAAP